MQGFEAGCLRVGEVEIAYEIGGSGPPVLLLHGFPQTRAMWTTIAPRLTQRFTVVCADLRGYGGSWKPEVVADYSFREMGRDQAGLMRELGFEKFHLVGHDRGARTAHRMALDFPQRVTSLTLMDIVPTHLLLDELTQDVAKAYYHWFFLAQPAPFPERLIGADPDYYFESCLLGWGASKIGDFDPGQLAAYRAAWRDADTIRGMCNDYRAAIEVDFALDAADLDRRVTCPTMVLYGADGAMARAYDVPGTWADRCSDLRAQGIPGGHFFPDTAPEETTAALLDFLG
ncbi:alpha/beta fold hydrolase [Thalassovita aquimarina]|uniref:Alpha/beta hydrolase n=1 Tax=Thalassovita aquimarina TaxID=2785917 RepID=A0ABS5HTY0_9RHOB|nr:alpha/beta hydrolase [Thalassovita aquimarina]MBR9652003.1 alpha/beta hydrolase [Thalassovita aquimarina]